MELKQVQQLMKMKMTQKMEKVENALHDWVIFYATIMNSAYKKKQKPVQNFIITFIKHEYAMTYKQQMVLCNIKVVCVFEKLCLIYNVSL
jgi:hypothetical protein